MILSQRHERDLVCFLPSGASVVASGAKLDKHDVRTFNSDATESWKYRYEAKCTQNKSYSLKLSEWKDLSEYSILRGERPSWAVRFYDQEEDPHFTKVLADLVIVDARDWTEILEELETLRKMIAEKK